MLYENNLSSFETLKKYIVSRLEEIKYNERKRKEEYTKLENYMNGTPISNYKKIFAKINMIEDESEKLLEHLLQQIDPYIETIRKNCKDYREAMAAYYIEKIASDKNMKNHVCICKMRMVEEDNADGMVACDGKNCAIVWYHLKCIGLEKMPEGCWLCKECESKEGKIESKIF